MGRDKDASVLTGNNRYVKNVKSPSSVLINADGWYGHDKDTSRKYGHVEFSGEPFKQLCFRHSRKSNVLWADGHVSSEGPDRLCISGIQKLPWFKQPSQAKDAVWGTPIEYTYGYSPYN